MLMEIKLILVLLNKINKINPSVSLLQFLSEQKIMDYSLLVGIHDMDKYEQDREEDDAETASQENGDAVIEEETEDSGSGECLTPPDSPVLTPRTRHVMIEEYDPSTDVYAVKGYESESMRQRRFYLIDTYMHTHSSQGH